MASNKHNKIMFFGNTGQYADVLCWHVYKSGCARGIPALELSKRLLHFLDWGIHLISHHNSVASERRRTALQVFHRAINISPWENTIQRVIITSRHFWHLNGNSHWSKISSFIEMGCLEIITHPWLLTIKKTCIVIKYLLIESLTFELWWFVVLIFLNMIKLVIR